MSGSWTQPVCRDCWYDNNPDQTPTRVTPAQTERCCLCGSQTRAGIYVRADPTTVPFPTKEVTE